MTGTFFGDFDVEDAWDNEPADPLQVAMRLHRYRRRDDRAFEDLSDDERAQLLETAETIVRFTAEFGPHERTRFATALGLEPDVGNRIADWLIRQGAWQ